MVAEVVALKRFGFTIDDIWKHTTPTAKMTWIHPLTLELGSHFKKCPRTGDHIAPGSSAFHENLRYSLSIILENAESKEQVLAYLQSFANHWQVSPRPQFLPVGIVQE